jgi:8-oxo-dGTP pyrophosphatase MutT (NUDIX family)
MSNVIYSVINVIIHSETKEILMLYREEGIYSGHEPVKGKIKKDELKSEALNRETLQETGLKIGEHLKVIGRLPNYFHARQEEKFPNKEIKTALFVSEYTHGKIKIGGDKEHKGCEWMAFEEANEKCWLHKFGDNVIEPAYEFYLEKTGVNA